MKLETITKKKVWKVYKYVEIRKHTPDQSMGQRRNQKEMQENILRQTEMDTQHIKTCGMLQKQF